jgi:hypothetical protein
MSDISIGHNNPPELIKQRQPPPPIMPGALLCTIPQAAATIGGSDRGIYRLIAVGQLQAVKSGKRTLVVIGSLHEYAAKLPAVKIKREVKRHVTAVA